MILPKWAHQNARYFVNSNRKALESTYAHLHINEWIDLIFGYKQQGDAAIESVNVFYPLTYENAINLDEINDVNERNGILDQISEYGQTPKQLFKKPHPEKKKTKKIKFLLYNPILFKNLKGNLLLSWNDASWAKEKIFKFRDFCIKFECDNEFFENMRGLSSFISKKGTKMTSKEIQSNTNLALKGCSFYGNPNRFINFDSCYNLLLIFEGKPFDFKFIKSWSFSEDSPTSLIVSNGKKHIFWGDKFGTIRMFKILKKQKNIKPQYDLNLIKLTKNINREKPDSKHELFSFKFNGISFEANHAGNSNEKTVKKQSSKTEPRKLQTYEIRFEQKKKSKFHFSKIHSAEGLKKPIKFQSVSNLKNEMVHSKRDFINFYDIIYSNYIKQKEVATSEQKKDTHSLEFVRNLNGHTSKITCLEICYSFSLLISCDVDGVVCLWNIDKQKLLQKIFTFHFYERKIFNEICIFDSREYKGISDRNTKIHKKIVFREKIKGVSICQENGDFLVFSKNYVSLYSVNGVLISILSRVSEKLPKFSAVLLVSVRNF